MSLKKKIPAPLSSQEVLEISRRCLNSGGIIPTPHLKKRMLERNFNMQDIINVIENGNTDREPEWNDDFGEYNYFIKGKDIEGVELILKIAISSDHKAFTIITGY